MKGRQVSLFLPRVVVDGLDNFIEEGNADIFKRGLVLQKAYPESPMVDISRSGLIRLLLSMFGNQHSQLGDLIANQIYTQEPMANYVKLVVTSKHPLIIENQGYSKLYALVSAMVAAELDIPGYVDKNDYRATRNEFK